MNKRLLYIFILLFVIFQSSFSQTNQGGFSFLIDIDSTRGIDPICTDSLGCIKLRVKPDPNLYPLLAPPFTPTLLSICPSFDVFVLKSPFGPTDTVLKSSFSGLTRTFCNIPVGVYSIVVREQCDVGNARNLRNTTIGITNPIPASAQYNAIDANCFGDTGTAYLLAINPSSPPKPPYIFYWDNNLSLNDSILKLLPGNHTLTVQDSKGCKKVVGFTFFNILKISPKDTTVPVTCHNDCNAIISVIQSNGIRPLQYSFINANTGAVVYPPPTPLNGGYTSDSTFTAACADSTYIIAVKDNNGCIDSTRKIKIFNPPPLSLDTTNKVDLRCVPGCDGKITLTPSGGVAFQPGNRYKVQVLKGPTDSLKIFSLVQGMPFLFDSLCAGNYELEIKDSLGCKKKITFTIKPPSNPLKIDAKRRNVLCAGDNNGTAWVDIISGQAPFTYSWVKLPPATPGCNIANPTNDSISNLCPGTYVVTVTDSFLCVKKDTVIITQPDSLKINVKTITQPLCFGDLNGIITVGATGGVKPYSFSWNLSPFNSDSIKNTLGAGTYTITVKDANLCTRSVSAVLNQPDSISIKLNIKRETCVNSNDGSVVAIVTGGTRPYAYAWNGSSTFVISDSTRNNLAPGNYNVIVRDANNCVRTATYAVLQAIPFSVTTSVAKPNCSPLLCDGILKATISGGKAPFIYEWRNVTLGTPGTLMSGSNNDSIFNLCSGSYTVKVTDSTGCMVTARDTLEQAIQLIVNITSANLTCISPNSGSATATVINGNPPFNIVWTRLPNTIIGTSSISPASVTGLGAGTYVASVTDFYGCKTTDTAKFIPPPKVVFNLTSTDPLCFGGNNGSISATYISGKKPFTTVRWSRITSPTATIFQNSIPLPLVPTINVSNNMIAGIYQLYVVDANGCDSTFRDTVKDANKIVIAIDSIKAPDCIANPTVQNGYLKVKTTGGRPFLTPPPYTYTWKNITTNTVLASTNNFISSIGPGLYRVVVTDRVGCRDSLDIPISNPDSIDIKVVKTKALCHNTKSASMAITVKVSVLPTCSLIIAKKVGTGYVTIATQTLTVTAPNTPLPPYNQVVGPGIYLIRVIDALGCEEAKLDTIISNPRINVVPIIKNPKCFNSNDGIINVFNTNPVSPFGGSNPLGSTSYIYTLIQAPAPIIVPSTNDSNLISGNYTYEVRDLLGCRDTFTATLLNPPLMTGVSAIKNQIKCFGDSNAVAYVTANGGTPPYVSYAWPNGTITDTAYTLKADTFNVIVTDVNGCTVSVPVQISQPGKILATLDTDSAHCFGTATGSVKVLSVTGGNPPFKYSWNVNPPTGSNASTINNLFAGNYTLLVNDTISGCVSPNPFTIKQDSQIVITLNITQPICFGGGNASVQAVVKGGAVGFNTYTFVWKNLGTNTIVGTNSSNLAGSNITAGNYSVTVTDAKGCSEIKTFVIANPTKINANLTLKTPLICFKDTNSVVLSVPTGGTGPYDFVWTVNNPPPKQTTINQVRDSLKGGFGMYYVSITDAIGCNIMDSLKVDSVPEIKSVIKILNPALCDSNFKVGVVSINIFGGQQPFTFTWSHLLNPPGPNPLPLPNPRIVNSQISTEDSLGVGPYLLNIVDNKGCKLKPQIIVPSSTSSPRIDSILTYDNKCSGDAFGAAKIKNVIGGTPPYRFTWLKVGTTTPLTTVLTPPKNDSAFALTSGFYHVIVRDLNLCARLDTFQIKEPAPLKVNLAKIPALCKGINNGSLTVTKVANTGTGTFTYQLKLNPNGIFINPTTLPGTFSNLAAGNYTLRITDAANCIKDSTFNLAPQQEIKATINKSDVNCFGENTGSIVLSNVNGSVAPYSFQWNDPLGQATAAANNLAAGIYLVTVTASNGCVETFKDTIRQKDVLKANYTIVNTTCKQNAGSVTISSTSGGQAPYTHQWSNGISGTINNNLFAGVYTVIVADALGCKKQFVANIKDSNGAIFTLNKNNINCFGANNGSANINITSGIAPYTVNWLPSGTSAVLTGTTSSLSSLSPGNNYVVQVKDSNNCISADTFSITQPAQLALNPVSTASGCAPNATGSLQLNVSGGTGSYTYVWAAPIVSASNIVNNLQAGTYIVTVTDAVGCSSTQLLAVNSTNGPVVSVLKLNQKCATGNTGSIVLNANGGTTPYTYNWQSTSGPAGATSQISSLAPGQYAYVVSDAAGCINAGVVTINPGNSPQLSFPRIVTPKCFDSCNASIVHIASGGNYPPPYTYTWTNTNAAGLSATKLCANGYTFTVTDINGCTATRTDSLKNPLPLTLSLVIDSIICLGDNNGKITATVGGGTPNFNYNWTKGTAVGNTSSNLGAGSVKLTVTDANGCKVDSTVTLAPQIIIQPNAGPDILTCPNKSETLTAISNVLAETFTWYNDNNGVLGSIVDTGKAISVNTGVNQFSTTFYLEVRNKTCVEYDTIKLLQPPSLVDAGPDKEIVLGTNVEIGGNPTGSSVDGLGVTYLWSPNNKVNNVTLSNPIVAPLQSQTYYVEATHDGCTFNDSMRVVVVPTIVVPSGLTPNGDGLNDTWQLNNIEKFPNNVVEIFNRWGEQLYIKRGYRNDIAWDARYNGQDLPVGTYYFVINLNDPVFPTPITGPVTILR